MFIINQSFLNMIMLVHLFILLFIYLSLTLERKSPWYIDALFATGVGVFEAVLTKLALYLYSEPVAVEQIIQYIL